MTTSVLYEITGKRQTRLHRQPHPDETPFDPPFSRYAYLAQDARVAVATHRTAYWTPASRGSTSPSWGKLALDVIVCAIDGIETDSLELLCQICSRPKDDAVGYEVAAVRIPVSRSDVVAMVLRTALSRV